MRPLLEILRKLSALEVRLWVTDGGELAYDGRPEALTPMLLGELREHKDALLSAMMRDGNARNDKFHRAPPDATVGLTSGQRRLWFLAQLPMEGAAWAYNMTGVMEFVGPLRIDALEHSLAEIAARHSILRTYFPLVEDLPIQQVGTSVDIDLPILTIDENAAEVEEIIQQQAKRKFDLSHGPLYRFTLLRRSATHHQMVFTLHHTVADAISLQILFREMGSHYNNKLGGLPSKLSENVPQFRDFAFREHRKHKVENFRGDREYWANRLADLPPALSFPSDAPRLAAATFIGGLETFSISESVTKGVEAICSSNGATLLGGIIAVYAMVLGECTGAKDIIIGIPISTREESSEHNLMGLCINFLPIRVSMQSSMSVVDLIVHCRDRLIECIKHKDIPYELIVEELSLEREPGRDPLLQAACMFQPAPFEPPSLAEATVELREIWNGSAKFDVTFAACRMETGLRCSLEYRRGAISEELVHRMATRLVTLMAEVASGRTGKLGNRLLLSQYERDLLDLAWRHTFEQCDPDRTIVDEFDAAVLAYPLEIALTEGDGNFTFQSLDERSRMVAGKLHERGIGPADFVGLCTERSISMVAGMLGILRSGAGFVPLSADLPKERMRCRCSESANSLNL